MLAKFELFVLILLASLHFLAQIAHGYARQVANVHLSLPQLAFIVLVVTILPWLAIAVAWKMDLVRGATLFALSMAASFLFGYVGHFVLDSPDLHSNVVGQYGNMFFHTALGLALLEFNGFVFGLLLLVHGARPSDRAIAFELPRNPS